MAGYIVCVIGGKGGVGKSQIATNWAFAYAQESRGRVLLLDFDQKSSGDLNILTGMHSTKNLKDLSDFNGPIDPNNLMPFMSPFKNNVSYITMPSDTALSKTINVSGIAKVLKALPNIFPMTVIDLGSDLNELALKTLQFATLIFLVTSPDLLALNQTKRLQQDLITELIPKEVMQIIVNQYKSDSSVTLDVISKQMSKSIFAAVPLDENGCSLSLSKSTPLMLLNPSSAMCRGVTDCVRKVIQKSVLKTLENVTKNAAAKPTDQKFDRKDKNGPWIQLKSRIHKSLVDEIDIKKQSDEKDPKAKLILREQTKKIVIDLLGKEDTKSVLASRDDYTQIVKEILDEALGLGPLEDLLDNKYVTEIMVVGPYKVYYEEQGKLKLSVVSFTNNRQVLNVIERIVAPIGRRIDEKTPYVDARLEDGSRVHAIIAPCALDGASITIRKFPEERFTYKHLVDFGSLTQEMADFLRIVVEAHRNVVISGGTGSGKTTLINVLASFIPSNERIITCEDSAELSLGQEHVVRLETRPPTLEGDGEISMRLLVKQTLRMRPDRIIVGECRGGETLDMLQAMGTGHDGSLTTVHSNSPRECLGRLETLVQYAGSGITPRAIKEMISSSVHLIVQQSRLDDGTRKVTHISEVSGMQGDVITLQDIFIFKRTGFNKQGKILGKFQATGFIPKFIEVLESRGYNIPRGLFTNNQDVA